MTDRRDNSRHIRARRGNEIKAKHWSTEAAVRMLMNNLDDQVAENWSAIPVQQTSAMSAAAILGIEAGKDSPLRARKPHPIAKLGQ